MQTYIQSQVQPAEKGQGRPSGSGKAASGKLNWVYYARGIAVILVVYRHAYEGLKNTTQLVQSGFRFDDYLYLEQANIFFFSFRMPLFFIVSGVFLAGSLSKRGFNGLLATKSRTILYPYFLWGFVQIGLQILASPWINSKKDWTHLQFLFYVPREVEQFWYLLALFNVTILYALLKSRLKLQPLHQLSMGLILFLISALFSQQGIEWGFISDIFHYYIFFAIGDTLSTSILKGGLRRFLENKWAVLILLVPFVVLQGYFLSTNLAHRADSPKFIFVEYHQPLMYLLISLTGCLFIISISAMLARYERLGWLIRLGEHSLHIFVLHVILFAAARALMIHVLQIREIHLLLAGSILAGVAGPVLIARLVDRLGWNLLFSLEPRASKPVQHAVAPSLTKFARN